LTEPGADDPRKSGKTKLFYLKMETLYHQGKKCDFEMQVSEVHLSFCSYWRDDKNITGSLVENTSDKWNFNMKSITVIRALRRQKSFFNETKVPVETCYLKEEMVSKLPRMLL
jgi:hypothetical protein